jgi:hypothetical protein
MRPDSANLHLLHVLLLPLVAAGLLFAGCAHTDFVAVEVHCQGPQERFYMHRDGYGFAPAAGGIAGGVGGVTLGVLGIGAYVMFYVLGIVLISDGNEPLGISLITGGMVSYFAGLALLSLGINLPFIAIGEWGRQGPDVVRVNLWDGGVVTEPPGKSSPLLGRRDQGPGPSKASKKPRKSRKKPSDAKGQKATPHVAPVIDPKPGPAGKIDAKELYEE